MIVSSQGANVGLVGGMGFGGTFAAFQVATKALCVFGVPGAVAGGALGLIGGCVVGGMAGGLPFATAEALFRKYAEKFKILDETLSKIDQILLENFEVLTEICRLLGKLKKAAQSLSELEEDTSSTTTQEEDSHTETGDDGDDTNIDFLIGLNFDSFRRASEELEKNCDYLLDDMPLKALGLLSLDEKCSRNTTLKDKEKW
jgi:BMFP domain-containing protein YqiC